MRYRHVLAAAAVLVVSASGLPRTAWGAGAEKDVCHGTSVEFVESPSVAARLALKEKKLVFVLHVSGNFEDPRFT